MNRTHRLALRYLSPLAALATFACGSSGSTDASAPQRAGAATAANPVNAAGDTAAFPWLLDRHPVITNRRASQDGHDARVASMRPATSGLAGTTQWATSFNVSTHGDYEDGVVAVDARGNTFIRGYVQGYADFGNGVTLDLGGEEGQYLLKVDSAGNALWVKSNLALVQLGGVATDDVGNVYAASGNGLESYDTNGNLRWSKSVGAGSRVVFRSIGGVRSILIGGGFSGTLAIDGVTVGTAAGVSDGFVAQLRADTGAYVSSTWITDPYGATPTYQDVGSFDAAPDGSIVIGGFTYGGYAVDGYSHAGAPGAFGAGFAVKVNGGAVVWTRQFGGVSSSFDANVGGLAADSAGSTIVTGPAGGSINLGGGALTTQGYDTFIAKYDASGTYQWGELLGGAGADFIYPLAVDAAGNILLPGISYSNPLYLNGQLLVTGTQVPFLTKLDGAGNVLWNRAFSGAVAGLAIATSPSTKDVYLTLVNYSYVDLGTGPLSIGSSDETRVLAKIAP